MSDSSFMEASLFMRGFQVSKMIHVLADIGLADRIDDKPRPVAELAEECGVRADILFRVCRALAAFGIYRIEGDGQVGHTERSRHFRRDASPTLHYAARFFGLDLNWLPWNDLAHVLKTGEPAFENVFGMPNFDYLSAHPDESAVFDAFMQHSPDDRHAAVAEAYPFGGLVIDVGGGNGALIEAILRRHGEAHGVVFDQPAVVAGAEPILRPYGNRGSTAEGSFFAAIPPGGDIYTMSQILHDWSDARCLEILGNIRTAMRPGAKLLIIERILDEAADRNTPFNVLGDMQMMVLFPGARERTQREFGTLLEARGFRPGELIRTRSAFCVLEAEAI